MCVESNEPETYSCFLITVKNECVEIGDPFIEFVFPVVQGRLGNDDEMGSLVASQVFQVTKKRDGLQRFTETLQSVSELAALIHTMAYHLICEDTVNAVLVQRHHPIQALHLVVTQSTTRDI